MNKYKIHIGADGSVRGYGPNVDEYQPYLDDGDEIVFADTAPIPTDADLYERLRTERDARLVATDKYLLADYPTSPEEIVAIRAYRTALRDLPDQPGAPWDGGGDETPWPTKPIIESN